LAVAVFGTIVAMIWLLRRRLSRADLIIALAFGSLVLIGSLMLIRLAQSPILNSHAIRRDDPHSTPKGRS
jgi:hypothetical protein